MSHLLVGIWRRIVQGFNSLGNHEALGKLGDFTATTRMITISGFAIVIGVIAAFVALALLRLIGLFTNLFFFQRWEFALVSPSGNHLGILGLFVPVAGALIIGFMARFGSERIRGHGIPEAIEAILINGSKIQPKVAILKPLSSAISIGSGGPFGAEGPIIMTGGAIGSMIAQFFQLTSAERKTLLVAGAAAGMAATFSSPVAATLLAVELLLFEWKPRSLVPVALACATATVIRRYIIGLGPLFPVVSHPLFIGPGNILACVLVGLLAGALSSLLTVAVYASEDVFRKLPIHWMWWPAIGGLVIGIGGLIYPQALGVGYDVINQLLQGHYTLQILLGVLIVKSIIWSVSLGSGTSGGVLAPLLIMGGALGGLESLFLPNLGPGFWPLVSMGATLGGTMRSPFTGVIFMLELTHDVNMLLPLLVTVVIAHGFTVLVMRRSILTEKVSRRGYHLSREYAIDPLEIIFVREVMRTNVVALPDTIQYQDLVKIMRSFSNPDDHDGQQSRSTQVLKGNQRQRLFPVLDTSQRMVGVVTHSDLAHLIDTERSDAQNGLTAPVELQYIKPVVAYTDEPLRAVVYRMAETGFTRLPVVERDDPYHVAGMISLSDLLKARTRSLTDERQRERILRLRLLFPRPPASQENKKTRS